MLVKDIKSVYPPKIAYTERNISLAGLALDNLWEERCKERGEPYMGDRAGSCKFAALLARSLFGGRLAGNYEHVFVVSNEIIIDLNITEPDALRLGSLAYLRMDNLLTHRDYRAAFESCLPRVNKWVDWVLTQ